PSVTLRCLLRSPAPPRSTLFPYTTLFRSGGYAAQAADLDGTYLPGRDVLVHLRPADAEAACGLLDGQTDEGGVAGFVAPFGHQGAQGAFGDAEQLGDLGDGQGELGQEGSSPRSCTERQLRIDRSWWSVVGRLRTGA